MRRALPLKFWPPEQEIGGARKFLRFIETELKAFIAGYYDVDETDQTLLGVSLGGLFVLHALFEAPGSFQRHIAISPSIWWNERAVLAAEERAAKLGGVRGHLFMGVGADEEAQAPEAGMVSNLVDLSDRLKAREYPDLHVTRHVFEGEGHMSVTPAAISRGLRAVFAS
jgi:predicted alpha/beta superfamily hydrolase